MKACDFIEWDVRNWSGALDCWLQHGKQDFLGCTALEIGSNQGGLSLWMALQGAQVICTDIDGPPEIAIKKHLENGVSHLITYESIDATNIGYSNHFDVVLFKSVLGGIGVNNDRERQAKAVSQMYKALKKGGQLFFAENLVASPLHHLLRRGFVKWGAEWRYVSLPEMQEFLSPFSAVTYRTIGFLGAFGRTEKQREALSWLDKYLIGPLVPTSWRYIVAGVATK
jgi:SAM-dependent methyltransferase